MRAEVRGLGLICVGMMVVAGASAARGAVMESLSPQVQARGGLCVLIGGMDDITVAESLLQSGPWAIHWLDNRPEVVEDARRALLERGLYGRIVVEHWTADHLPYADNLVNLLIVRDGQPPVDQQQALRVLAPEGFAFFAQGDGVERLVKPRPEEMGHWTHPWHDADGSLASSDRAFGIPNAFQWIAGPPFPLAARKDSAGVILSAGGRVFSITQNVPENVGRSGPNYLVARDAFNGKVLWSQPWEGPLARGHWDAAHEGVVATADRVYGAREEEVVVFDAATGEVLQTWPTRDTPDKLLLSDGLLVAQMPGGLTAFDVARSNEVWHHEADDPWGTVVRDGRVFCLSSTRERDGRWLHELLALDLGTGQQIWRQPTESEHGARGTAVLRLHFAGDGIVCLIERHELRVLSAEDGRELWRRRSQTEARGGGSMDSRQVGHFYVNGNVWMRMDRSSGQEGAERWVALDPLTGEVRRELDAVGPKGVINVVNKVSCQPLTATQRFVFDARLSTVWDFETGERGGWKFARGTCQIGMVPANGLAYIGPNACGCLGEQLRGTLAVVRTDDPGLHSFLPGSLERGPAYGQVKPTGKATAGDWPTYRRDGRRSAQLPESVSAQLRPRWRTAVASESGQNQDGEWRLHFGRPLTPPVVADGLVLLAEPQTHQVIALDEGSGAEQWRFTAGGRVSLPPTLYQGLALFGAHDGYVYALRGSDGQLVWRLRAAPSDRRIMAYGQVESAWPVVGGVLVHQGLAVVAAGRTTDADGGVVVHAIQPHTGEVRWTNRVEGAQHGKGDLLVSDGEHVYLMNMRLDVKTGDVSEIEFSTTSVTRQWKDAGLRRVSFPEGIRYLRSGQAGFLHTSWTLWDMGLRKHQSSWTWSELEGELLAFTQDTGFGFQIDAGDRMWSRPRTNGGGRIKAWPAGSEEPAWSVELSAPAQVEAMLVTDDALFIAGPEDRAAPEGPAFLRAMDVGDGRELANTTLPIAPVHDGIAAASGRLVAVLRDGSVIRLDAE